MSEVVRVPFHGAEIHTVLVDDEPHVVLRPSIEAMGLSYSRQLRKLQTRSWATVAQTATVAEDGKVREMTTVDLDTWAMLLANIDENRVADEVRPLVVEYQRHSARALRDFWTRGGAINPSATADQLADVIRRAEGQARVLAALRGVVDAGFLDARGRQIAARALGETPEYDPLTRPLTVSTYLGAKGLSQSERRRVAGQFGKVVKGLYVQTYGEGPPEITDLVGRHMVPVAQYQERHRPLMDAAWSHMTLGGAA